MTTSVYINYSTTTENEETTTISSRIHVGEPEERIGGRGSDTTESTVNSNQTTITTTTISQISQIVCTGNTTHICSPSFKSIDTIKNFDAPSSANCGDKIKISFKWNGWHYEDPNYWAFFLKNSEGDYSFVDSCKSNVVTDKPSSNYSMSFDLQLPNSGTINNGVYELFVTGEDNSGYCNPNENGVDAQSSRSITLNNCGTVTSSSTTTTTISGGGDGCGCNNWTNQGCGLNGCTNSQQYQIRTCSPLDCAITSQCVYNSTCVPTCTDPDSGSECLQYITYGSCTDVTGSYPDECKDDYHLAEMRCTNDGCISDLINCTEKFGNGYGCKDGKCALLSNPISGAMVMLTGAVTQTMSTPTGINLFCTGSPSHGGSTYWDIDPINELILPDTADCGETIKSIIQWTGWHGYDTDCEPNYWGFFLETSPDQYYFLSSCESFYPSDCPLQDPNTYVMEKKLKMPDKGSVRNGQYKIYVTGETYGGYSNPFEADPNYPDACKNGDYDNCLPDAQIYQSIELKNCEVGVSSTTTTTTSTSAPTTISSGSSTSTTTTTSTTSSTTISDSTPQCAYILSTTSTTTTTTSSSTTTSTSSTTATSTPTTIHVGGGGSRWLIPLDLINALREFIAKIFGLKS
jgi:hypothetical protein